MDKLSKKEYIMSIEWRLVGVAIQLELFPGDEAIVKWLIAKNDKFILIEVPARTPLEAHFKSKAALRNVNGLPFSFSDEWLNEVQFLPDEETTSGPRWDIKSWDDIPE